MQVTGEGRITGTAYLEDWIGLLCNLTLFRRNSPLQIGDLTRQQLYPLLLLHRFDIILFLLVVILVFILPSEQAIVAVLLLIGLVHPLQARVDLGSEVLVVARSLLVRVRV